ncbi:molybdenum cofactor guanylyltransferase MobA [Thermococcus sp.]|uniref:molybdenum cofactor guanylyltransferase MobA n=1 Tax=Thermococcus sp. TaxID=35749 RepID=UPI00263019F6|nr:molybdenum cofactor guanylyltransferase MobA [Thermococcus sp.]
MLGAVLAGGRARRFGEDKLLFRINGKPLILHTLEALKRAESIDEVVLVVSPNNAGRFESLGHRVIVDDLLVGPMSGVYTALHLGDAFVVAGDMPLLVPDFVDFLISEFRKSGRIACVPRWENGYLEPLHAVYSRSFVGILHELIKMGDYALNRAVREADPCYVPVESLPEEWRESFFNVNTREDLKKIRNLQ